MKKSYENLFFILLLYYTLTETPWKHFIQKRKAAIFFHLEFFVDKTTLNFYSFNKVNCFVTNQYTTVIFYLFYLNP